MQLPVSDLDKFGVMNESEISMRLGLPGIAKISETIALERGITYRTSYQSKVSFGCVFQQASLMM